MQRRTVLLSLLLLVILVVDAVLVQRRGRYVDEAARLRASMTSIERQRADAIVAAEADKSDLMLELLRRQAAGDNGLHLAVNIDSSYAVLERDGATLRRFPVVIGPERRVGIPPDTLHVSTPRGTRSIERILTAKDTFDLPAWIWADRAQPRPEQRSAPGWTGASAIVTSGGTLIYALPVAGPLADSSYVMPGAIRAAAADLAAIRANLTRGLPVYFF